MNCKPGDLAIVTHTPDGSSIGAVVRVIEAWGSYANYGHLWTVQHARPVQCFKGDGSGPSGIKTILQHPDAWLKPVSGLPIDDEVTEDLKEPA